MIASDEHYRRLERLYLAAPVNDFYAPTIRVERARAEISIDVRREFMHAASAVHGAVVFKLLDDSCFFAVNSLVGDVFVLTASFNLYLLRPVDRGTLAAIGQVVHAGRNLFVAEGEVADDGGRIIARGSGSFMRSEIPLDANVGYA